jgi:hypothetical protein
VKYFAVLALLFCASAPAAEKLPLTCPTYPDCGNSQRVFDAPTADTMVSTEAGWVRFADADEVLVCLDDLELGAHTSECPRDRKIRVPRCEVAGAECAQQPFLATPSVGYAPLTIELQWDILGAQTCIASGSWSGEKPAKGSQSVTNITAEAVYMLACQVPTEASRDANLKWRQTAVDEMGEPVIVRGFRIYRADGETAEFRLVETFCEPSRTNYTKSDLLPGTYRWQITSFVGSGECSKIDKESAPSNIITTVIGRTEDVVHTAVVTQEVVVTIKYPPTAPVVTAP